MEFRTEESRRFHIDNVVRGYPDTPTGRTRVYDTNLRDGAVDVSRQVVSGAAAEPGRTLTGYPVVFNRWTEIQSWDGPFMERIAPDAADKTIQARGDKIVTMFNHGLDMTLEQTPIGIPTRLDPDWDGVYAEAALVDRGVYPKIDLIVELIRMGAIWGQSFRFSVLADSWVDEPEPSDSNPRGYPERTINEFRWYEFGPVTYPAYEATSVGLRNANGDLLTPARTVTELSERHRVSPIEELLDTAARRRSPRAALDVRRHKLADAATRLKQLER